MLPGSTTSKGSVLVLVEVLVLVDVDVLLLMEVLVEVAMREKEYDGSSVG
jgi:hypothetical protein